MSNAEYVRSVHVLDPIPVYSGCSYLSLLLKAHNFAPEFIRNKVVYIYLFSSTIILHEEINLWSLQKNFIY